MTTSTRVFCVIMCYLRWQSTRIHREPWRVWLTKHWWLLDNTPRPYVGCPAVRLSNANCQNIMTSVQPASLVMRTRTIAQTTDTKVQQPWYPRFKSPLQGRWFFTLSSKSKIGQFNDDCQISVCNIRIKSRNWTDACYLLQLHEWKFA